MKEDFAIRVEKLIVHYDKTPVLWEVDFSIPKGVLVGVIGPNGAGKSTLLKTLLGVTQPTSGRISFQKQEKKLAYVPQRTTVDWNFPINVLDVVLMGRYGKLGLLKWPKKEDRLAAQEALEKVGMLGLAKRQISELSGGQQQRVFFARALLQDADLYFLDEPFAGIDMATERALMKLLTELKAESKTLLVVHHDLTTVKSYFDWVVLLNTCLIADGPTSEVFTQEMIKRAYGSSSYLFEEAKKLQQSKASGVSR